MSYIVRASWWEDTLRWTTHSENVARRDAEALLGYAKECGRTEGPVTITKDGEVIREYKVGDE